MLAMTDRPSTVWVKCGICSADSVINILLCVLGFLPGLLHAWYIIAKYPEPDYGNYERVGDSEHGRVTYIVVSQDEDGRRSQRPRGQGQPKPASQGNMSYGTSQSNGAGSSSAPAPQGHANGGEGSSEDQPPPPSYAQVVMGDNKIQDQSR